MRAALGLHWLYVYYVDLIIGGNISASLFKLILGLMDGLEMRAVLCAADTKQGLFWADRRLWWSQFPFLDSHLAHWRS